MRTNLIHPIVILHPSTSSDLDKFPTMAQTKIQQTFSPRKSSNKKLFLGILIGILLGLPFILWGFGFIEQISRTLLVVVMAVFVLLVAGYLVVELFGARILKHFWKKSPKSWTTSWEVPR